MVTYLFSHHRAIGRVQRLKSVAGRLVLAVIVAILFAATDAREALAGKYALLVGVAEYPNLPGKALTGPPQDIRVMQAVLSRLEFGSSDVSVLADGIDGVPRPTRAAIVGEVRRLIDRAGPGDTVVIFLAGHGSLQPALQERVGIQSVDGFDAIFLPADTGRGSPSPPNAIPSYEIAGWVRELRQKGVFLWLIVDACNSGFIDRALEARAGARDRRVLPEELGIQASAIAEARDRARVAAGALPRAGTRSIEDADPLRKELEGTASATAYAAFFAAQSTETTPEYPLPDDASPTHGLFTYTLAQAVLANPSGSLAQYRDAVRARYNAMQRWYPRPAMGGAGLDRTIAGNVLPIRQWPLIRQDARVIVPAGQISGVTSGSVLALFDDPLAPKGAPPRGYVRVGRAGAFDSDVAPVEHRGAAPPDLAALGGAFARITEPAVPMVLRVALPSPAGADDRTSARVRGAIDALRRPGGVLVSKNSTHVEWLERSDAAPDVVLAVDGARVWFAGRDGSYVADGPGRTPSVDLTDDPATLAASIWAMLQRVARWTNVARLASDYAREPLPELDLELTLARAGSGVRERIALGQFVDVADRDGLDIFLRNTSTSDVDVTVLYVNADYRAVAVFPQSGQSPRLPAAIGRVQIPGSTFSARTAGTERLYIVATQASPQTPPSDFRFLADESPPAASIRALNAGLEGMLANAGFATLGMRDLEPPPRRAGGEWIGYVGFGIGRR